MAYKRLGPRPMYAAADTTGNNAGKYTTVYSPKELGVNIPYFEVYHIAVSGPPGASFTVYLNNHFWDSVAYGVQNGWDPSQPMILEPGDTVYLYWNTATTVTQRPFSEVWLRGDTMFGA